MSKSSGGIDCQYFMKKVHGLLNGNLSAIGRSLDPSITSKRGVNKRGHRFVEKPEETQLQELQHLAESQGCTVSDLLFPSFQEVHSGDYSPNHVQQGDNAIMNISAHSSPSNESSDYATYKEFLEFKAMKKVFNTPSSQSETKGDSQ